MDLEKMIGLLNEDLKNEWKHLRYYLHHASLVQGLHCEEYKEFLLKAAAGEMQHVTQFSDVIVGLGGTPTRDSNDFPIFHDPKEIVRYALQMEEEVVKNYVQRLADSDALGGEDGAWLHIFLEDQIQDSRSDADHLKQIVRGFHFN